MLLDYDACSNEKNMSAAVRTRAVPVSCFIYRCEDVKPSEKWSMYTKIELNQRFLDLRNRFHIGDYGDLKKRSCREADRETRLWPWPETQKA